MRLEKSILRDKPVIGVIGESVATDQNIEYARETGVLIAERHGILICGGMGGVMKAACEGAKSAGGLTIGIIPTYEKETANEYIDISIATGMGHARNAIIAATADALIAIGGSYGTLSEIAFARKFGKPVITLASFEIQKDGKVCGDILAADTPRHAVSRLWKILESTGKRPVDAD
jgi:uncharacterized protein (TIGR00725 family)